MCCVDKSYTRALLWCINIQVYNFFGAVKGLIGGTISGVIGLVCDFCIAVVLIPHDIWYTYRCVVHTKMLGPNLRMLVMLLLPVPLLLWPVVAAKWGFLMGFFTSGEVLFMGGHRREPGAPGLQDWAALPYSGVVDAVTKGWRCIKGFAEFNYNSYFCYLEEVRRHPGPAFDISPWRLIMALFVAIVGGILGLVGGLLQIIKAPLLFLRGWWELIQHYIETSAEDQILFFIPFLLGMCLIPVGVTICAVLLPVSTLVVGFMWAGIKGYACTSTLGMSTYGLAHVWNLMHELEKAVNDITWCSFCPIFFFKVIITECPSPHHTLQSDNTYDIEKGQLPHYGTSPTDDDDLNVVHKVHVTLQVHRCDNENNTEVLSSSNNCPQGSVSHDMVSVKLEIPSHYTHINEDTLSQEEVDMRVGNIITDLTGDGQDVHGQKHKPNEAIE